MSDIKPGKRYFSVVYEITNPEEFQVIAVNISGALADERTECGARVTACGWGDYATERDAYEDELREKGVDPEEVIENFIAIELAEVGSFPEGQAFNDAVRDITG